MGTILLSNLDSLTMNNPSFLIRWSSLSCGCLFYIFLLVRLDLVIFFVGELWVFGLEVIASAYPIKCLKLNLREDPPLSFSSIYVLIRRSNEYVYLIVVGLY